jgi:hypothetical protein
VTVLAAVSGSIREEFHAAKIGQNEVCLTARLVRFFRSAGEGRGEPCGASPE